MVVIAILAIAGQMVMVNLQAMVPSAVLNTEAKRVTTMIEFLRSEAQLQGKRYQLEIDLDQNRYRPVLPPEEKLVSTFTIENEMGESWTYLEEGVEFRTLVGRDAFEQRNSRAPLVFDENGFTADMLVVMGLANEENEDWVWTIELFGLDRRSKIHTSVEGVVPKLQRVEEFAF